MTRIKIDLPSKFAFSTTISIRITDINYGGHVGNDTVLSIIHEARMQFLKHYGYTELDIKGTGLIMSDVAIEFKRELFYGDQVKVSVAVGDFSKVAFEVYYKLETENDKKMLTVATAKTGMVCYDYKNKKIAVVPEEFKQKLGD